jgi:hypothetical protein
MKKMLIAALVGGLLMFAWSAVAHLATSLGTTGVSVLPPTAEQGVISGLKSGLKEPGFYYFPGKDNWPHPSKADDTTQEAKAKSGPEGILIAAPVGKGMDGFALKLAQEALFDVICGLVMAVVLMHVPKSMGYLRRAGIGALLGAYGAVDIDGSYHTFYGFPASYFGAQLIMAVVGAFVAGLAVAALVDAPE